MSQHAHSNRCESFIELKEVAQSFSNGERKIVLFNNLNFRIHQGQSYAITGPSGSGKSSLLMLASGLEAPARGNVIYHQKQNHYKLNHIRSQIGYIFQQFHLLPELDALNNVALPLKLRGHNNALSIAHHWLEKVGLGDRLRHKPSELSGGEQQRVAIARALVFSPKFIFADEPTGNLDTNSAKEVANLLFACCKDHGAGLVLVTHSEALAGKANHELQFSDGDCAWKNNDEKGAYYE